MLGLMAGINDHERKVFSQNGEDGIIEFLAGQLASNNHVFIELGTSDGQENNTFHLLQKGWRGLGVDANAPAIQRYAERAAQYPLAQRLRLVASSVTRPNCLGLIEAYGEFRPALFVIDIDGIDYYVVHRLLEADFRPSIVCCEYNSFMGMHPLTVAYDEQFERYRYDPARGLYFGASVPAWRHLLQPLGYRFCGVDSAGVNAFFCFERDFRPPFPEGAVGSAHVYTDVFVKKYGLTGIRLEQELLARRDLRFVDVTREDVGAIAIQWAQRCSAS